MTRTVQSDFPRALRFVRQTRGRSQEALDVVSGRTYVSALERGVKQPTIGKLADLAGSLDIHPLTLMALSFMNRASPLEVEKLLLRVREEVSELVAIKRFE
ncbi:helix-turn-helix transcriptional regulator [Variovorax sp. J22P271]|uniref:helix-turn-helix domain-containing protein n=1 Tax=Variovorax davisae TaxID=3053515 RepID=UPI002576C020|nr:helix-turn-helix transcriptional regulator [Variovorax sp. J22P271]MDM0032355.1 helix-turn-helix transcriptional regulator [Variovorax sp. J22P271]